MDKEHVVLFKETYDKEQKELRDVKETHNNTLKILVDIIRELSDLEQGQHQLHILSPLFHKLDISLELNGQTIGNGNKIIKLKTL